MRQLIALLVLWVALFAPATMRAQQAPSAPAPAPQTSPAKSPTPQESSSTQGNPDVQVWVNTNSGVYHCPNTRWYGATKSGVYMKQTEAQQKGYRPAYHRVCR
jgi:hypothetical protein